MHSSKLSRVQVTLTDLRGGRPFAEATVGGDGSFEFRHVPYGEYRLTAHGSGTEALSIQGPIAVTVVPVDLISD